MSPMATRVPIQSAKNLLQPFPYLMCFTWNLITPWDIQSNFDGSNSSGPSGASSTHPCVRAIPSLPIFKLVHVYLMSSRTPRFLLTKGAKRTWHLSLINNPLHARVKMISRMWKHMNLLEVNTFISMRICAGWSMHLLSSMLYRLSSCGWMFLFMCRYCLSFPFEQ